jgi:RimJ/RimL family protein N-acetyltransferase
VITEVLSTRIETYSESFPGAHAGMVVASIAAGNTAAQLWEATHPPADRVVLLWDKGNNVFYLSGQLISDATRRDLAQLMATQIRPQALAEGLTHFKVRALSPSCEDALGSLFGDISLREAQTLFYGFEKAEPNRVSAPIVDDIRFAPIDRAFLLDKNLENIEHVRAEIRWMWPSEDRFYEQGFGYAAAVGERVVCWCTAEYVSAARCGVGIETDQAYERRGVATATAARFVEDCKRRALTPYWECRNGNIGSIRVAEKVGFEQIAEERYWVGAFEG